LKAQGIEASLETVRRTFPRPVSRPYAPNEGMPEGIRIIIIVDI
jgi:hypothetical protein